MSQKAMTPHDDKKKILFIFDSGILCNVDDILLHRDTKKKKKDSIVLFIFNFNLGQGFIRKCFRPAEVKGNLSQVCILGRIISFGSSSCGVVEIAKSPVSLNLESQRVKMSGFTLKCSPGLEASSIFTLSLTHV